MDLESNHRAIDNELCDLSELSEPQFLHEGTLSLVNIKYNICIVNTFT